jgi:hypothetical protein
MSNKYGEIALEAARSCRKWAAEPRVAWDLAAQSAFPRSKSCQTKACPRNAFLGLCSEGLIRDVPKGDYTRSVDNRRYAVEAVAILRKDLYTKPSVAALWRSVIGKTAKKPNGQMNVVLALWTSGQIIGGL